MSKFSGEQGKGAMKRYRIAKRKAAEERNRTPVGVYACGHKHGQRASDLCWELDFILSRRMIYDLGF